MRRLGPGGFVVALALLAGCGSAPVAAQSQPPLDPPAAVTLTAAPTVEPSLAALDTPTQESVTASAATPVAEPTRAPVDANAAAATPSTAAGSTAAGSTTGGSTAGGPTAGGSTAGGPPARGPTAAGSTPGGPTIGGSTAGPSIDDASTPDASTADAPATDLSPCDQTARPDPLPAPGSPRSQDFFRSFRLPLPPAPLYDPPGPKRIGLQAGHWLTDQVPAELGRLQGGAVGGGKQEWQVNLDVAQRTAGLLEASGIQVDVLPATVPPGYQANAFIALHADGDTSGATHGFKVARPGFSSIPDMDDRLVAAINQTYGAETELPRDDEHISLRMRYYYAFNSRRYCHAVAPGVPQAIVEMAYLTNAGDRQYLIGDPDRLARALADSIQAFLATEP